MLLRKWLYAIILFMCSESIYSQQLTLGNTPYALKKSAVLELNSNNQGLLMPRISDTNLINALLPPDGMLIYHTGVKQIMVRAAGGWQVMPTNGNIPMNWYATGNSGTNPSVHFLGTIDDKPMIIKSNNQVFWEFGRRQTLGLTQAYPDYTDNNEKVTHLKSALQFEATGAQFYKPKMFVDADGNFRMKGSSAGTDYFEFGSTGSNNNGGFEFVIGDDGDEPIVFKSYNYSAPPYFTEIMRLQSGKMGLGTTTPTEKLDVSGNVRFSGALMPNNIAGTSGYVLKSNGGGTAPTWVDPASLLGSTVWMTTGNSVGSLPRLGTNNNYDLPFYTNNSEGMRLTTGNRLGIGTTAPAEVLDVNGNIKISGGSRRLVFGNVGGDPDAAIELRRYAGTESSELLIYSGNDASTTSGPDRVRMVTEEFRVQTFNSSAGSLASAESETGTNTRFIVEPNGDVGVNTAAPTAKLDVNGTFKLGNSGTVLTNIIKGTITVTDNTAFQYNEMRVVTVNVPGVTIGNAIMLNPRSNLPTGVQAGWVRVSSNNYITIGFTNSGYDQTIGTKDFDITIIQ